MRSHRFLLCTLLGAMLAASVGCGRITPSRRNLRSAVEAKRAELDQCYEATVARNANVGGTMTMWLNVDDESGRVHSAELEQNGVADDDLPTCVGAALEGIQLPEPPPLAMRVEYTFEFRPAGAQPPPPAVPAGGNQPPPPAIQGM
jgi:hypothetical protein